MFVGNQAWLGHSSRMTNATVPVFQLMFTLAHKMASINLLIYFSYMSICALVVFQVCLVSCLHMSGLLKADETCFNAKSFSWCLNLLFISKPHLNRFCNKIKALASTLVRQQLNYILSHGPSCVNVQWLDILIHSKSLEMWN